VILVIDNYDSFTYNLVQYLAELGQESRVVHNDALTVDEAMGMDPDAVLISPGPGRPGAAGISEDLIRTATGRLPLLGVCLGHQALGTAFGARVVPAPSLMHGKTSLVWHDGRTLFEGLPNPFEATRYHSLVLDGASLPDCFEVSAWIDDGTIMGIRHTHHALEGVQFHPESILTRPGRRLLANFLDRSARRTHAGLGRAREEGG
jgi:anthranilate synthase/aminodeoxychorismate synthase-like glutamine amidotransferase